METTTTDQPRMFCETYVEGDPDGCARCGEHRDYHETPTPTQIIRPATRARVQVTFPDGDITQGAVVTHYDDGFDLVDTWSGETWTLFDVEQADARCVVTVLS